MTTTTVDYNLEPDHDLLNLWQAFQQAEMDAREQRQRIEMTLQNRMHERGATAIPHETLDCQLDRGTPTIDIVAIQALRELLPPEVINECCTEAHTAIVAVPERWDQRCLNASAKYGADVYAIIEKAKVYGEARLRIKARKSK